MSFRLLGSRRVGSGVFLALHRIHLLAPDGRSSLRDVVRHPGSVAVLPVQDGLVHLIRQYRVAIGQTLLEIPAGKLDRSGEDPESAAGRELEEELGMRAARFTSLGCLFPSPGYTDEIIHLFSAEGIVPADRIPEGAEEREAEVVTMSISDALSLLERGEILDAKTQIALAAWARRNL